MGRNLTGDARIGVQEKFQKVQGEMGEYKQVFQEDKKYQEEEVTWV